MGGPLPPGGGGLGPGWLPPFDVRVNKDGHRKVHQWSALADFWNLPAVQHFGSIPELIQGLWLVDLAAVSQGMWRHHTEVLRRASSSFYIDALRHLFGPRYLMDMRRTYPSNR